MDRLEAILSILEDSLDTKRKRHIAGGVLMSISLFFGGLATTILTIQMEVKNNEKFIE